MLIRWPPCRSPPSPRNRLVATPGVEALVVDPDAPAVSSINQWAPAVSVVADTIGRCQEQRGTSWT
jgi:hypothetical protein